MVRIRCEPSSSAGFGGRGPVVITRRFSCSVDCVTSSSPVASDRSRLDSPWAFGRSKIRWMPGLRKSASSRIVRRPAWAKTTARLAAVVVLPSPGTELVTRRVRSGASTAANSMLVRRLRYASATGARG